MEFRIYVSAPGSTQPERNDCAYLAGKLRAVPLAEVVVSMEQFADPADLRSAEVLRGIFEFNYAHLKRSDLVIASLDRVAAFPSWHTHLVEYEGDTLAVGSLDVYGTNQTQRVYAPGPLPAGSATPYGPEVRAPLMRSPPLREPSSGVAWEIGAAFALGLPCIGFTLRDGKDPIDLMLAESVTAVAYGYESLLATVALWQPTIQSGTVWKDGLYKTEGWKGSRT
jgi:nucleoside 2-deoxyribosyltransferase